MTKFEILPAMLSRHGVGFDRMFEDLSRTFTNARQDNYPPFNIVEIDETHLAIEVAVAGFKESDLNVEVRDQSVVITGKRTSRPSDDVKYHHKGISSAQFERVFPLAEHIEVRGAKIEDGILAVALEVVIPEDRKPRKVTISVAK
jgi:molecular chaperone IbpA